LCRAIDDVDDLGGHRPCVPTLDRSQQIAARCLQSDGLLGTGVLGSTTALSRGCMSAQL
jgi:hypothetical protein